MAAETERRARVLCAPDKFRGSLTNLEAAAAIAAGVRRTGLEPIVTPMADGGEGTIHALIENGRATPTLVPARAADGRTIAAPVAHLGEGVFLVESATVLAAGDESGPASSPLGLSSEGLGDLIRWCVRQEARRVHVALGGVATIDGGIGLLASLGVEVPGKTGASLQEVTRLDLAPAQHALRGTELRVLHDVDSPLTGPTGAVMMFGAQKGVLPDELPAVEAVFARYASLLGAAYCERPGAGAAGGLGAALYAIGASASSGARALVDLLEIDQKLDQVVLCLTGEGRVDASSDRGKVVSSMIDAVTAHGVPCVVIGGVCTDDGRALCLQRGAYSVVALGPPDRDRSLAFKRARTELEAAAAREAQTRTCQVFSA